MKPDFNAIPKIYRSSLKRILIFVVIFALILLTIALINIFSVEQKILKNKRTYLKEMTLSRAEMVNERINNDFNLLISLSKVFSRTNTLYDKDTIFDILKSENYLNNFLRMGLASLDGNMIVTDKEEFYIQDRDYYKKILNGEPRAFSSDITDRVTGDQVSVLSVPVYETSNEKILRGILFATIKKDAYNSLLYSPSYAATSVNYIIDADTGQIEHTDKNFIKTNQDLSLMEDIIKKYGIHTSNIKKGAKFEENGIIPPFINGKRFFISYAPIGINNWYLYTITPRAPLTPEFIQLLKNVLYFSFIFIFILVTIFLSYIIIFTKMFQAENLIKTINSTISKTFILGKIKKKITTEIGKTFNADSCAIKEYNPITNTFHSDKLGEYIKANKNYLLPTYDSSNLDKLIFDEKYIIIEDYKTFIKENNLENDAFCQKLIETGYISAIRIPIKYDNTLIGILSLNYKYKYNFNYYELSLLLNITEQIAMAIKQAKSYERSKEFSRQEKLLKEILSLSKSSLELNEVFNILCNKIKDALDVSRVSILKFNETNKKNFQYFSSSKNNDSKLLTDRHRLIEFWLDSFIPDTIQNYSIIQNSNLPDFVKQVYGESHITSIAIIPIKVLSGYILLALSRSYSTRIWSEQNIETFYMIKDYLAILLKDHYLYNESKYLSNVSHELKTPLAIINNYAEILSDDENLTEQQKKPITKIKNNIERMTRLIDDILYISSIDNSLDRANINLTEGNIIDVIKNSIEQCTIKANEKNIKINFNPDKSVINLKLDALLLQQAFINVINNSINYSTPNKTVSIEVVKNDKTVVVTIEDQGFGMTEEDLQNIFKRFFRGGKAHASQPGVGLGLPITEKIINYHNALLDVESTLNKGTKFIFSFNL